MRTLEKLKENGFLELNKDKLQICFGGTSGTITFTQCNNLTGVTTTTTSTTTDYPDGSMCITQTTTYEK